MFALAAGGVWRGERLQPLQWFCVALVLLSVLVVSQRRRLWEPVEVDSDVLPGEIG